MRRQAAPASGACRLEEAVQLLLPHKLGLVLGTDAGCGCCSRMVLLAEASCFLLVPAVDYMRVSAARIFVLFVLC